MGYGLSEKVFTILSVQLRVEAQLVFRQMRHASLLSTQLEAHLGSGKGTFEKGFSLLVALFYAAQKVFGHKCGDQDWGGNYAQGGQGPQP